MFHLKTQQQQLFWNTPRKLLPSADLLPNSNLLPVTIGRWIVSLGFLGGIEWEVPNLWIPKMCANINKTYAAKIANQTKLPAPLPHPQKRKLFQGQCSTRIWLRVICYWKMVIPGLICSSPTLTIQIQIITLCQRPKTWLHRKNLSLDDFKGIFFH